MQEVLSCMEGRKINCCDFDTKGQRLPAEISIFFSLCPHCFKVTVNITGDLSKALSKLYLKVSSAKCLKIGIGTDQTKPKLFRQFLPLPVFI